MGELFLGCTFPWSCNKLRTFFAFCKRFLAALRTVFLGNACSLLHGFTESPNDTTSSARSAFFVRSSAFRHLIAVWSFFKVAKFKSMYKRLVLIMRSAGRREESQRSVMSKVRYVVLEFVRIISC